MTCFYNSIYNKKFVVRNISNLLLQESLEYTNQRVDGLHLYIFESSAVGVTLFACSSIDAFISFAALLLLHYHHSSIITCRVLRVKKFYPNESGNVYSLGLPFVNICTEKLFTVVLQ